MKKQLILFLNFIFLPLQGLLSYGWLMCNMNQQEESLMQLFLFFFLVPKQQAYNGNKYYKVESFSFIQFIHLKYIIEHFFSISSYFLLAWLLKAALLSIIWLWQSLKYTGVVKL